MTTEQNATSAAELRALGRLMRYARAQGYTYYVTTSFGRTDWSWSKDGNYVVSAEPLAVGWRVHLDDGRADLWPASVRQLTDVLVAVGLLPATFSSIAADYEARILDLATWEDGELREGVEVDELLGLMRGAR